MKLNELLEDTGIKHLKMEDNYDGNFKILIQSNHFEKDNNSILMFDRISSNEPVYRFERVIFDLPEIKGLLIIEDGSEFDALKNEFNIILDEIAKLKDLDYSKLDVDEYGFIIA